MPVGAFGEAAAVGLKPNAPSTLVTSFCTPAATAFTAAPSDGLAFGLSCMGVAACSVATVETTVSVLVPVCTTGSTVSIATTVLSVPPVATSVTRRDVSGSAVEVAWAWTELFFFGLVEAVCPRPPEPRVLQPARGPPARRSHSRRASRPGPARQASRRESVQQGFRRGSYPQRFRSGSGSRPLRPAPCPRAHRRASCRTRCRRRSWRTRCRPRPCRAGRSWRTSSCRCPRRRPPRLCRLCRP